jgi:hypothetical protein
MLSKSFAPVTARIPPRLPIGSLPFARLFRNSGSPRLGRCGIAKALTNAAKAPLEPSEWAKNQRSATYRKHLQPE